MNGNEKGTSASQVTQRSPDWTWWYWFLLPLYPYWQRRTLCRELVAERMWSFEQLHGILYTVTEIRMTVVRLDAGGLLVYAPIAPTRECLRWVAELEAQYGAVRYILLPTASGLEHKVFVAPFARCFPQAQVFVAPQQWSFPIDLPLPWLGLPPQRTQVLPLDSRQAPFAPEFDYAILDLDLGRGAFVEVALLHKATRTLLLTDLLLAVQPEPPAIAQLDPYPLLFHAREDGAEAIVDTPSHRRRGWQRIVLFAVYFRPAQVELRGLGQVVRAAVNAPDRSRRSYFGLYPWRWQSDWQRSFEALWGQGRPFVAPILQTLILPQAPRRVRDWVEQVAGWEFTQIVPCHFAAPIPATPQQFRQAFQFLEPQPESDRANETAGSDLPPADVAFIGQLEAKLRAWGIATAPREKA